MGIKICYFNLEIQLQALFMYYWYYCLYSRILFFKFKTYIIIII